MLMFDAISPSPDDLANRAWAIVVPSGLIANAFDVIIALHGETVPIIELVSSEVAAGSVRLINSVLQLAYSLEDVYHDKSRRTGNDGDSS